MSDYGLLSRKLTLDVEYEDTPFTMAHAKVPVFAIGREQLYEMFGLYGSRKPNPTNFVCDLESLEDCIQDCKYALVCFGHWADGTPSRMVTLCNVYETLEQSFYSVGCAFEVDAFHLIKRPAGVIYDYEVWQICDDSELYGEWNVEIMAHVIQRSVYGVGACNRKHEPNSKLFSEDYLSSLKTYNEYHLEALRQLREAGELELKSRMKETCYFCGCFLPGKNYSVQVGDDMKLVCRACFNLFNKHDHEGLLYRTIDTFICDCCGRTMKEEYYVDTSIGVYCSECKAENPDLGEYFVCDRCGKRLSVEHLSHTVSGVYCKHCKSVLCQGLTDCCGDICDPGTFPDPTCHGCEYCNCWSHYYD